MEDVIIKWVYLRPLPSHLLDHLLLQCIRIRNLLCDHFTHSILHSCACLSWVFGVIAGIGLSQSQAAKANPCKTKAAKTNPSQTKAAKPNPSKTKTSHNFGFAGIGFGRIGFGSFGLLVLDLAALVGFGSFGSINFAGIGLAALVLLCKLWFCTTRGRAFKCCKNGVSKASCTKCKDSCNHQETSSGSSSYKTPLNNVQAQIPN